MNEKVAKRRDALINLTYAAVIFGLLFLFFRYCFWVAAPFLLTFLFAVINQRPLREILHMWGRVSPAFRAGFL